MTTQLERNYIRDGKFVTKKGTFEIGSFLIIKNFYEIRDIDNGPKIIISRVQVLDKQGEYIDNIKLEMVINYLPYYNIKFESKI